MSEDLDHLYTRLYVLVLIYCQIWIFVPWILCFNVLEEKWKTPFLQNPQTNCNMFCAKLPICLVAMNHKAKRFYKRCLMVVVYCRNCHCHSRIYKTTTHCYPYSCLDTSWGCEYSFFVHIKNDYIDWKKTWWSNYGLYYSI